MTSEEIQKELRRERKRAWYRTEKGKAYQRKRSAARRSTPEFKVWLQQYSATEDAKQKARAREKRYRESEKGKAVRAAWHAAKRETEGMGYYQKIKSKYATSDRGRTIERDKQRRRRSRISSTPGDLAAIATWEMAWRSKRSVRCYWCGERFSPSRCHTDHVQALAAGGSHTIDNLCISCAQCNWKKNDKPLSEWNQSLIQMALL